MFDFKSKNFYAALLGAIIIGAIGSGVWDALFKPIFQYLANIILRIGTLGLNSLVDGIYLEVAKGNYERSSLSTFLLLESMFIVFIIFMIFILFVLKNKMIEKWFFRQREITSSDKQSDVNYKDKSYLFTTIFESKFSYIIILIYAFFLTNQIFFTSRTIYIIRASNNIQQIEEIIFPYINESERLTLRSNVAQIRTKGDYLKIIDQMGAIANEHKLYMPTFSSF